MAKTMRILYGTTNAAKLSAMRERLAGLPVEIIGINDLQENLPDVEEDGKTPLENARKKALAYFEAVKMPVFSCDTGLYIENIPKHLQPGIHVRTVGGKRLTDEEMVEYYGSLAREYGDLVSYYGNAICLVMDEEHVYERMDGTTESERFLITAVSKGIRQAGFPLDGMSVDIATGKYYYDLSEEERLTRVAVADGFRDFFEKVLEQYEETQAGFDICRNIRRDLFSLQENAYRQFQSKLIPNIPMENIIGVRMPAARKLAKRYAKEPEKDKFLHDLPHRYYDENNIHGFLIMEQKDFAKCVEETDRFLSYVDNWATCDMLRPKAFAKNKKELLPFIEKWMASPGTYQIRFGIGILMTHFLEEEFDSRYAVMVAKIRSEEYYVKMMVAWYFATALAKQWEEIIPFLEQNKLDMWCHNKTIQKSLESFRIPPDKKAYLRTLKRK